MSKKLIKKNSTSVSSLENSVDSLESSINSLKSSIDTLEKCSFSISLTPETKSSSIKSISKEVPVQKSRCENKKLKPCSPPQIRNLTTCRCNKKNKIKVKTNCEDKKLKPCSPDQIRNLTTCRCNKIKIKKTGCEDKKLKPCSPDQIRNLTTCRCNKIKSSTRKKNRN
jgi:hypothetical protein